MTAGGGVVNDDFYRAGYCAYREHFIAALCLLSKIIIVH